MCADLVDVEQYFGQKRGQAGPGDDRRIAGGKRFGESLREERSTRAQASEYLPQRRLAVSTRHRSS
jgi:hypothetical protein